MPAAGYMVLERFRGKTLPMLRAFSQKPIKIWLKCLPGSYDGPERHQKSGPMTRQTPGPLLDPAANGMSFGSTARTGSTFSGVPPRVTFDRVVDLNAFTLRVRSRIPISVCLDRVYHALDALKPKNVQGKRHEHTQ